MENLIQKKNVRHGGIDLFRVVAMFMVVILHVNGIGGVLRNPANTALSPLWFISSAIQVLCVVAVNCFALITGFVNVGRKTKLKSLISLWFQAFFISIVVFAVKLIIKEETFSFSLLVKRLLPVTFNRWWYFTAYFLLFFFIPILNLAMEKFGKVLMASLIIALGVIFCGIGYIMPEEVFGLISGYSFLWLAYLYLVGAYIKKYDFKISIKGKPVKAWVYLAIYLVISVLHFVIELLLSKRGGYQTVPVNTVYTYVLNFLASVALLLFFANLKFKTGKTLMFFSSTSFGVYLIHIAVGVNDKFQFLLNYHWAVTIALIFAFAIAIYLACTIIEYLRQLLFKVCKINVLAEKIDAFISKIYAKLQAKFEKQPATETESVIEAQAEEKPTTPPSEN